MPIPAIKIFDEAWNALQQWIQSLDTARTALEITPEDNRTRDELNAYVAVSAVLRSTSNYGRGIVNLRGRKQEFFDKEVELALPAPDTDCLGALICFLDQLHSHANGASVGSTAQVAWINDITTLIKALQTLDEEQHANPRVVLPH